MRIGIPRGLLFYRYFPLWESFFEGLGVEVVLSSPTTERTLQEGSRLLPGDLCLPIKIFFGHTIEIKEKVDFLFIPRYIRIEPEAYMCPKLMGLPDMVRAILPPLPPLIDLSFRCKDQVKESERSFYLEVGKVFTRNKDQVEGVYQKAKLREDRFRQILQMGFSFEEAIHLSRTELPSPNQKKTGMEGVGVIGRPYYLHDPFIRTSMVKEVEKRGYPLLTPECWSEREIKTDEKSLRKRIYWSFGKEMVETAIRLSESPAVRGIILLSSFGCGQDSFNVEMIRHLIKERIPLLSLTFDEHLSQMSFSTRIEAFLELVQRKEAKR
jgi:predicted nucleotide-binding protein (sugar kinase/HSP70/actin superfamily)